MKTSLRLLFALLTLGVLVAFAAEKVTTDALLKDATRYDGKIVTVTGIVHTFNAKTSKKGNDYFVMDLKAKEGLINVYGQGKLEKDKEPKKGDKVEVTGRFVKEKKMTGFTVRNEVSVVKSKDKKDEEKSFGIVILK